MNNFQTIFSKKPKAAPCIKRKINFHIGTRIRKWGSITLLAMTLQNLSVFANGQGSIQIKQYQFASKLKINDGAILIKDVLLHIKSCSVNCSDQWGNLNEWEKAQKGKHILLRYENAKIIKTLDGREFEATKILVPLPDGGWKFSLIKTHDNVSCMTKCSPESLVKIFCNKKVGVSHKNEYKQYCK